jgi:GDPmannose 4,6-dehydratase
MPVALITGISGQDGQLLAQLLLKKDYSVFGMVNGQRNESANLLVSQLPQLKLVSGDLADISSLIRVLQETQPDEIYNLGAISFVGMSFAQPELTANITGMGVLRLLEAVRITNLTEKVRIYQASSSEQFGKVREVPQTESTPFYPRSPYGVAKAFAHNISVNYREAYGMHISCGILFNHESELRGYEFVTRKISSTVARISLGLEKEIRLGDLTPQRDWGYAGDYVNAMWLMLQQEIASDFVIATGETHSVREFLELSFAAVGLEGQTDKYLKIDERFIRPSEVNLLIGDPEKARKVLGWQSTVSFPELVKRMVLNDLEIERQKVN